MSKSTVQGFSLAVLLFSVLSSALAEDEINIAPGILNCSFVIPVGKFPSLINLCPLERNVYLSVYSGKPSPSVQNIHRYYLMNAFSRIRATANSPNISEVPYPDPSSTNCPLQSTSCLVSKVTFTECNNDQDKNGVEVCYNEKPIITADSYGWEGRWKANPMYPPEPSNAEHLNGSTVIITMQGGPCYYCDEDLMLTTVIGFYCDERITGLNPVIVRKQDPSKPSPKVLLHWKTSAACYQFNPNEQCNDIDFFKICKLKPFGCDLGQERTGHQYIVPPSANRSIISRNSSYEYIFGFCAKNVRCNSTEENDVMICRKNGQESRALAYYSDGISFIARPTGFVMRINDQKGTMKAVISFECSQTTTYLRKMMVLDKSDHPILLTLKHSCFCPDSGDCQGPSPSPTKRPTSYKSNKFELEMEELGGVLVVVVVVVVIVLCYRYQRQRVGTRVVVDVDHGNGNSDDDGGGTVDGGGGGLQERNEGGSSTNTSSTYHTCDSSITSNNTMLSAVSGVSKILDPTATERTPLLSPCETQESGV